ncbi:MAG TPA: CARDB domain-containing protein, partial [Chitinophagaceae bacterium]|nr:CARDB domain-containing protein [Chitinophagaceae bacterium]
MQMHSWQYGYNMIGIPNNDMGVTAITAPASPMTVGSQPVTVTISNFGGNTLTSANINFTVNGGTAVTQAWTGSLAPCQSVSFTFSTPYNFTGSSFAIKAYTSSPNGLTDPNNAN